ncbi:MAG TPA: hypothetical protein VM554_15345 [Acidisarcina sp.]|nr:hypothetical protein [Acidisarcina sp.]
MTRQAMLRILISHAKVNGFEFRKWFRTNLQREWPGSSAAIDLLSEGSRYYALVFSHSFARCFWKQGTQMSFVVPAVSYTRRDPNGQIVTVTRKAFTRRTLKADVWRYHLREMAVSEDPLLYLRRFLPVQEDLKSPDHPRRDQRHLSHLSTKTKNHV